MDPLQASAPGHTRTRSGVRPTRPRSSTKGPLDIDDNPLSTPQSPALLSPSRKLESPLIRSPAHSPSRPQRDLTPLLRPEIYHPLPSTHIPPPFRISPHQPSPSTPLPTLLASGHYRAAAISAAQSLIQSPIPPDPRHVFDLLHVRLASLTLTGDHGVALAAQEVRSLPPDLDDGGGGRDGGGGVVVPWGLRVLLVRLRAIGYGDSRRAVMSYYDLARECRLGIAGALRRGDASEAEVWRERLDEIGVRVAGALVEMDDLVGAGELLRSGLRKGSCSGRLDVARALVWLQLGDVEEARGCVSGDQEGGKGTGTVEALCAMADGEYEAALGIWREIGGKEGLDDEMVGVNMAVCLLYCGRMQEGRALLEKLVDAGYSSHTLLFNLTTMYELCTERPRGLKMQLAEKVAAVDESSFGWEKTNADFKL